MHHRDAPPPRGEGDPADAPPPPPGLSEQASDVWSAVMASWILGAEERLLLEGALRSWDLYVEARHQLAREGLVTVNPDSGARKRNPLALVARDAFADFRAAVRQLGIESEVPSELEEGQSAPRVALVND